MMKLSNVMTMLLKTLRSALAIAWKNYGHVRWRATPKRWTDLPLAFFWMTLVVTIATCINVAIFVWEKLG